MEISITFRDHLHFCSIISPGMKLSIHSFFLTAHGENEGCLLVEDSAQVGLPVQPVGEVQAGQGQWGAEDQQVGQHLTYWGLTVTTTSSLYSHTTSVYVLI